MNFPKSNPERIALAVVTFIFFVTGVASTSLLSPVIAGTMSILTLVSVGILRRWGIIAILVGLILNFLSHIHNNLFFLTIELVGLIFQLLFMNYILQKFLIPFSPQKLRSQIPVIIISVLGVQAGLAIVSVLISGRFNLIFMIVNANLVVDFAVQIIIGYLLVLPTWLWIEKRGLDGAVKDTGGFIGNVVSKTKIRANIEGVKPETQKASTSSSFTANNDEASNIAHQSPPVEQCPPGMEDGDQAGQNLIGREAEIRANFADKMNVWWVRPPIFEDNVSLPRSSGGGYFDVTLKIQFKITRSISSMSDREAQILMYAILFRHYGLTASMITECAIVYNEGNCQTLTEWSELRRGYMEFYSLKTSDDAIRHALHKWGVTTKEAGITAFMTEFSRIEQAHPNLPLVQEFKDKIIGGSNWLSPREIDATDFSNAQSDHSLFLGSDSANNSVWYQGQGALITVAPPGSGKTQCHVFPNLVTYTGSAVVLDVKGECFSATSAWRKHNVGPVFKFNPLQPADSARYNPLGFIENDPDTIWEDCRLLADLLIVPQNLQDPSWENRARDVVAGVIAWLVRTLPAEQRAMGKIVDVVSKVGWDQFVEGAKYTFEVPPLSRLGNSLAAMPDRQLEGVLDSARRHLAVWEGARVEKVTSTSDWTPEVLRDGSNSTIYICIPPNEIESYAPLLRVIFAQHLRYLLRELPPHGERPILFMLDELPRLGPMRPVEEALEVGRQYGIRLWMFAQSLGQLEKAYANAEGMVGSCAVRVFMNPSSHDGTAKRLSDELGFVESILDGSRRLMVEPSDLAGPDYANHQIVIARNTRPAKLRKAFAYNEEFFAQRLES